MGDPIKVGLAGFGKHSWQSVDKTRQFFLDALEPSFDLEYVEGQQFSGDVLLNFSSKAWWQPRENLFPVINCVHGGATIDYEFLQSNLPNLYSSDGLIVNCNSDKDIFNSYCESPPGLHVLPLPVDHDTFKPHHDFKAVDDLIGHDQLVLGFFARLLPQKNLHGFINLFRQLKSQFSNLKAVVVGNYWLDYPLFNWGGENYPKYIENLINEQGLGNDVRYFTANLKSSDLALLMSRCDLVVHPTLSVDENFGYVVPEALSCGTPVIGSAYGGLKDTLNKKGIGFAMPTWASASGSRVDLNSGLKICNKYLSDASLCKSHGEQAATYGKAHFHVDLFKERLINIIRLTKEGFQESSAINRPVVLDSQYNIHRPKDFLPESEGVSWSAIQNVVKHYTSEDLDQLNVKELGVYPSAEFKLTYSSGIASRVDPLWPATFELTHQEQNLLEKVMEEGFLDLRLPHQFDTSIFIRLINIGVLNFTYEDFVYRYRPQQARA